jgi:hypothetical protein
MAKFQLNEGEEVVREEKAGWLKSKIQLFQGKLVLTNNRLVFCTLPRWAYGFGPIGLLLAKPTKVGVELGLGEIETAEQGSWAKSKEILSVKGGGKEHRFITATYEDWINALKPQA